jgi:hypothetical protein
MLPRPGFNSNGPILPMGAGGANVMNLLSNGTVGIGTNVPQTALDVQGEVKVGNTTGPNTNCPAAMAGAIRWNGNSKSFEGCNGTAWTAFGGSSAPSGSLCGLYQILNTDNGVFVNIPCNGVSMVPTGATGMGSVNPACPPGYTFSFTYYPGGTGNTGTCVKN